MPNYLYRQIGEFDETIQWQCLSCKIQYYSGLDEVFKFCPYCGTEYKKLWTKQNPRYYYGLKWKQHFPAIQFFHLKITTQKLASGGLFYAVNLDKPIIEWSLCGTIFPEEFLGMARRNQLTFVQTFQSTLGGIKKNYKPEHLKMIIQRWDGTKKEKMLW